MTTLHLVTTYNFGIYADRNWFVLYAILILGMVDFGQNILGGTV